ncbi:MAG: hypothetical protein D3910_03300 [Candidatus Electrothrix sp. ATG2]|nr:hypothetical protein [Candidatus Electrothrix sp. ATG2]
MNKISYLIVSEILFIVFPIFILAITHYSKGDFNLIISDYSWSFGSIVLFGQAIVKYISGLVRCEEKIVWQKAALIISLLILIGLIPSTILLTAFLFLPHSWVGLGVIQLIYFLSGCIVYYILSGTAEVLSKKKKV